MSLSLTEGLLNQGSYQGWCVGVTEMSAIYLNGTRAICTLTVIRFTGEIAFSCLMFFIDR